MNDPTDQSRLASIAKNQEEVGIKYVAVIALDAVELYTLSNAVYFISGMLSSANLNRSFLLRRFIS